ncbi:MAG TPA: hypothetical protein VJU61_24485 [Polyangiaceae bacterium]|nr:hypothetical protein [Polyangiaceae bacterium]
MNARPLFVTLPWVLAPLVSSAGCGGVPSWPVGVPPQTGLDGAAMRAEAALPLCAGATTCPELEALRELLHAQGQRCASVTGTPGVSKEVDALLVALAEATPGSASFPSSFGVAPEAFREASAVPAVDARGESPEDAAAVLFHGLWWSFWDRAAISAEPTKSSGYTHLIVFPDFEGRQPCKEW